MAALPLRANVFRAVADPTRRAMLELLREADRSVTELLTPFPVTQPAISQHLRILREAGLVSGEKVGRRRRGPASTRRSASSGWTYTRKK